MRSLVPTIEKNAAKKKNENEKNIKKSVKRKQKFN
jgi:hypothetical protein